MKRLLIFLFLSALLFNWIGYQLYHSITEQIVNKNLTASPNQQDVQNPGPTPGRLPNFHIALYEKELDFDDLFEFTSGQDFSGNGTILNTPADLLPDLTNKETHRARFKCFNAEYYAKPDKLFTEFPDAYSSEETPDRYVLKIPLVFHGSLDHPPQLSC